MLEEYDKMSSQKIKGADLRKYRFVAAFAHILTLGLDYLNINMCTYTIPDTHENQAI